MCETIQIFKEFLEEKGINEELNRERVNTLPVILEQTILIE